MENIFFFNFSLNIKNLLKEWNPCPPQVVIMAEYKGASSEADRAAQILKNMERAKQDIEAQKEKIRKVYI